MSVPELGSIREAAEVPHVVPSAISRQIAKLEEEPGAYIGTSGSFIARNPSGSAMMNPVRESHGKRARVADPRARR